MRPPGISLEGSKRARYTPIILRYTACQPSAAGCRPGISTAGTRRPRGTPDTSQIRCNPVAHRPANRLVVEEVRCGTQIVRAHEVQVADAGSLRADPIVALRTHREPAHDPTPTPSAWLNGSESARLLPSLDTTCSDRRIGEDTDQWTGRASALQNRRAQAGLKACPTRAHAGRVDRRAEAGARHRPRSRGRWRRS